MRFHKKITVLMLTMLMLLAAGSTVSALDLPDPDRSGSVSVKMEYDGQTVSGGSMALYRVGDVSVEDGNYSFILNASFADSQVSLEDIQSDQAAKDLAAYAEENGISAETKRIGSDGTVTFRNQKAGLYLMVQTEAADGFLPADPFLVSVPVSEDGVYLYDVDASPKMELEQLPGDQPPEKITPPKLPQTGQLNWPVPVLAAAGLTLCTAGWVLRTRSR